MQHTGGEPDGFDKHDLSNSGKDRGTSCPPLVVKLKVLSARRGAKDLPPPTVHGPYF
jgi:hypothetical protein